MKSWVKRTVPITPDEWVVLSTYKLLPAVGQGRKQDQRLEAQRRRLGTSITLFSGKGTIVQWDNLALVSWVLSLAQL
jgi:hypothetical protein